MIPAEQVLWALAVAGLLGVAGGVWLSVWWRAGVSPPRRKRPPAARTWRRGAPARDGLGWSPTVLYVLFDRLGTARYVGITSDVAARLGQHAADKEWAGSVASVRAWVLPDRYAALAAEWALILFLAPSFNRAPSGSCDSWTQRRPPIREVEAVFPMSVVGQVRRALGA